MPKLKIEVSSRRHMNEEIKINSGDMDDQFDLASPHSEEEVQSNLMKPAIQTEI